MASPNAERAAPGVIGNGSRKVCHAGERDKLLDATPTAETQADLLDRLEVAEQLSRWKLDLQVRLWRSQQTFMLVDFNHDFGPLAGEVEAFKRCCRAFAWRPGGAA